MRSVAKFLTAVLLAVALVAVLVPAGLYIGHTVRDAAVDADVAAEPKVPQAQRPASEVSKMTAVTDLAKTAPVPDSAVLRKRLDTALVAAGQGGFTGIVVDAITGKVLYDDGGNQPRVPASNTKLLTAVTALEVLGAEHRFSTQVVQGQTPQELILVGGGDVLLAAGESDSDAVMGHAGLETLAERTVASLVAAGVSGQISVSVDDSLFTGRPAKSVWLEGDLEAGQVAPVFPVALNSGRYAPEDRYGERPQNSALHAGRTFADVLRQAAEGTGISVPDGVGRVSAEADGNPLAVVQSATVAEQVELMLQSSDNYLAEALSRMAAHAKGNEASFGGATRTIEHTISRLGVDTTSLVLADSSGLSAQNRISPAQVAATLRIMVNTEDRDLAAAREGVPIAGLTGTLSDRYDSDAVEPAAGLVRAKTGTLNEVLALSGYVVTKEGRLLVFSFIGNNLGSISAANVRTLDTSAAILAGCGCSN